MINITTPPTFVTRVATMPDVVCSLAHVAPELVDLWFVTEQTSADKESTAS